MALMGIGKEEEILNDSFLYFLASNMDPRVTSNSSQGRHIPSKHDDALSIERRNSYEQRQ